MRGLQHVAVPAGRYSLSLTLALITALFSVTTLQAEPLLAEQRQETAVELIPAPPLPQAWKTLRHEAMPPDTPLADETISPLSLQAYIAYSLEAKNPEEVIFRSSRSTLWPGLESTLKTLLANAEASTGLLWLLPQLDPRPSLTPLLEEQEQVSKTFQAIQDYTQWAEATYRWKQAAIKLTLVELEWQERQFAFEQGKKTQQVLMAWEQQWLTTLRTLQQAKAAYHLAEINLKRTLPGSLAQKALTPELVNVTNATASNTVPTLTTLIRQAEANRPEWQLLRWVKAHGLVKKAPFWRREKHQAREALSIEAMEALLEQSTQVQAEQLLTRLEDQQAVVKSSTIQAQHGDHVVQQTQHCVAQGFCRALDKSAAELAQQVAQLEAAIQEAKLLQLQQELKLLTEPETLTVKEAKSED